MDLSSALTFHVDATLFASTFGVIFIAEIPDKTALAAVILATGNRPSAVFVGVAGAFVIQSFVAVCFGSVISLFPQEGVRLVAGSLFLIFAMAMWLRGRAPATADATTPPPTIPGFWPVAWKSFIVIFIAEWGDLTQLATAALSAKYPQPVTIFIASTLALWVVSAIAVIIGHRLKRHIDPLRMQRVAAIVFALLGALMLCGISLEGHR